MKPTARVEAAAGPLIASASLADQLYDNCDSKMNGVHGHGNNDKNTVAPSDTNADQQRTWIVQKFGGTSVGKFARDIVERVIQ